MLATAPPVTAKRAPAMGFLPMLLDLLQRLAICTLDKRPADFTDAAHMLGASPALLHGKIVRGGMGTGMPYWGPIYTDDQVWALVNRLYEFQFEYEDK